MNAKRNCYVGFLAGLGYTVESETKAGRPIYPEYDAESKSTSASYFG